MGYGNSDPIVFTLAANIAAGGANLKAKLWDRTLEANAETSDDFKQLEGAAGSKKPIWRKQDLTKGGGDEIVFTTIGGAAGPGVRGEAELTGNTSVPNMGTYSCKIDYWRDAVELTKKQLKFLATGSSLEMVIMKMLGEKLGRKRMYDMMMAFIKQGNGNTFRPNNRTSRDAIRGTDVITPALLVIAKARLQGLGARAIEMSTGPHGSPVNHYLAFIADEAMVNIRNSSSFQNALSQAATKSNTDNPLFNGNLVDWNGMFLFEHIIVKTPDVNDWLGSPMLPFGILQTAIIAGTGVIDILFGDSDVATNTKNLYSAFYPGYDWIWVEGQSAAPDSNDYFLWIVNQSGADAGKANFYKYTGTSNNGNKITIKNEAGDSAGAGGRLGNATASVRSTQVGNVTYAGVLASTTGWTDAHPVGSAIIAANKYGVPIGYSFILGAGAGLRAEGSSETTITQDRDYKFIKGGGYEQIWGQTTTKDTKQKTRNYLLIEHAVEHTGISVPYVTT